MIIIFYLVAVVKRGTGFARSFIFFRPGHVLSTVYIPTTSCGRHSSTVQASDPISSFTPRALYKTLQSSTHFSPSLTTVPSPTQPLVIII